MMPLRTPWSGEKLKTIKRKTTKKAKEQPPDGDATE
jgi:hypothetical protein